MTPKDTLKRYFGYDSFRPFQLEIIKSLLQGRDTLALLPTGGGKSICFQVPGLLLGGTTIVISPLISLMKDQVDDLNNRGISATYINSSLSKTEITERMTKLRQGSWQFIYVAPERLLTTDFGAACTLIQIPLLVIDEAHCISQWGHDFRPEYCQIAQFYTRLSNRPVIGAFTATATPKVKPDICSSLQLNAPVTLASSFKRSNIWLETVVRSSYQSKILTLLYLLKSTNQSGVIIYAQTRETVETLTLVIKHYLPYLSVGYYHAGLPPVARAAIQSDFLKSEISILVATNAFGMGINKPDVRSVFHFSLPLSLEQFYQELGRAGRDGQAAQAYLIWQPSDIQLSISLITGGEAAGTSSNQLRHQQKLLREMAAYAINHTVCQNHLILKYFGELPAQSCTQCAVCQGKKAVPSRADLQLFNDLKMFRNQLARKYHEKPGRVATNSILNWLTLLQPVKAEHYLTIPGVGVGWTRQWAQHFSQFFIQRTSSP